MRQVMLCLIVLTLAACSLSPNARRTEKLRVGMTKDDVVTAIGKPVSFGADRHSEVMYFRLFEGDLGGGLRTYFVRLIDGKVDSFGRLIEPEAPATMVSSLPPPPVVLPPVPLPPPP